MKKIPPAALYTLTTLLGAAAGFLSYRHYQDLRAQSVAAPAPSPPPNAPAAALSTPPAAEAPNGTIPDQVPDLTLPDLDGKRHALRAGSGRTRLFNFWASWCEPCRREIPLLNTLQASHRAEGLQITGIAVDTPAGVRTFLKATPLHYTVLVGEQDGAEAAEKFGMPLALPFTVFADQHQRIVAVKLGELHADEAAMILDHMNRLAAGGENLSAARAAISEALKSLAIRRTTQQPANRP